MNNPKISVIVPVYNAEKTLGRCVNSVLNQTYADYELLLIDDGSSDNSGYICDQYAKDDKRIKVFHKKNGGISSARKLGLDKCSGKFIQFIDSDDWIENKCLEGNIRIAENKDADIVINDFFINNNDTVIRKRQDYSGNLIEDFFAGRIFGALWNKLIKAELVKKSGVSFCHGLSFCEDLTFLCELAINKKSIRIAMNPVAYYHYCVNTNSLTKKTTENKLKNEEQYIEVMTRILPWKEKVCFQSNYLSIAWGYLKLGLLSFNEYKQKISKVSLKDNNDIYIGKRIILFISRTYIGYTLITKLFKMLK